MINKYPVLRSTHSYPGTDEDQLFDAAYEHVGSGNSCRDCDTTKLVTRPLRSSTDPHIHYGLVASGNQVMKHGRTRDQLAGQLGVFCFEMEAAGLMDNFPCLVIRGICDYSDSHKNKLWQGYSAVTAAAYAKELLDVATVSHTERSSTGRNSFPGTMLAPRQNTTDQLQRLKHYLSVFEIPEDDLSTLEDSQLPGSFQWFTSGEKYRNWCDVHPQSSSHYFLTAQAAAGKSVMAAHVIRNLHDRGANCGYFFFKHNDSAKVSLSGRLRSLAYQMALSDIRVRERLLELVENDVWFDKNSEQGVWRKIFLGGILELTLDRPHFWVIDALDECASQQSIMRFLLKLPKNVALRVFMTSRPDTEIERHFLKLRELSHWHEMTVEDTQDDIKLYLEMMMKKLPLFDELLTTQVSRAILRKSCGCFLWVVLVLDELRSAFNEEVALQIIEGLPQGMEPLYERTLASISSLSRGKEIVKTLLLWAVCAVRPLTIAELDQALKLDLGPNILGVSLDRFIAMTCRQLVHVDKSGLVVLVHETLRSFLLRDDLQSEFTVRRSSANGRITDVCLRYLNSNEMRPPPSQRQITMYRAMVTRRTPFVNYACSNFSHHLRCSYSGDSQRFINLCNFLSQNVCAWIEHLARTENLQKLILTAMNLKGFLQARAKYSPPTDERFQYIDRWEADLIRLASQYGRFLTQNPSAIFWVIPPFCPTTSAIAKLYNRETFGLSSFKSRYGIVINGLSLSVWNDRISCINYQDLHPRAVATSETSFAVALSDKSVKIYARTTCQEKLQVKGLQAPKRAEFSSSGKLLAVVTIHYLEVYDLDTGESLWRTRLPQECLILVFLEKDTIIRLLTKGGLLLTFSVLKGSLLSSLTLYDPFDEDSENGFRRIYTAAAFSADFSMMAATQRGRPVSLFDHQGQLQGYCERKMEAPFEQASGSAQLWLCDLVFSSDSTFNYIAALYHDRTLVLFNTWAAVIAEASTDGHVLARSPNGRTLATGSDDGTLQIFESESLNLIYKIVTKDYPIKSLTFTPDGLRILDVRGNQCNVWEPFVLENANIRETDSVSSTASVDPTVVYITNDKDVAKITALTCHYSGNFVVCGRHDGTVVLYSTSTGQLICTLYRHTKGTAVSTLDCCGDSNILVSTDISSRILVHRLVKTDESLSVYGSLLDERIRDRSITQTLLSQNGRFLLVSTLLSDIIYDLQTGSSHSKEIQNMKSSRWVNHPLEPSRVIHITPESAHVHTWSDISESRRSSYNHLTLAPSVNAEAAVKSVTSCSDSSKLVIEFAKRRGLQSAVEVMVLSTNSFEASYPETTVSTLPELSRIVSYIEHVIGIIGHTFFFLDRQMWVCSLELESPKNGYIQHCCIPDEWVSANGSIILKVTPSRDFVFVKKTEIAVIKGAYQFQHWISIGDL